MVWHDITPHDLRHTYASLMRAAGADAKGIQQQLCHQTATVTLNTYTHLFERDLDEVMDRLDALSSSGTVIKTRPECVPAVAVHFSQNRWNPLWRKG